MLRFFTRGSRRAVSQTAGQDKGHDSTVGPIHQDHSRFCDSPGISNRVTQTTTGRVYCGFRDSPSRTGCQNAYFSARSRAPLANTVSCFRSMATRSSSLPGRPGLNAGTVAPRGTWKQLDQALPSTPARVRRPGSAPVGHLPIPPWGRSLEHAPDDCRLGERG
jgi:hypothetical protein